MSFLSLPLCVHDWVLEQPQHTHCLQICTTSWLSFPSWCGMCPVLGSAQQETNGNSLHFWVTTYLTPEWLWFWGIYDCFECPVCVCVCVCVLVMQACPTLCNSMDCNPPGFSVHGILQAEYWSGLLFPSPEELPNLGIEPWSPASQADYLLFELISPCLGNHSMAASTLRHTPATCFLMSSPSMT